MNKKILFTITFLSICFKAISAEVAIDQKKSIEKNTNTQQNTQEIKNVQEKNISEKKYTSLMFVEKDVDDIFKILSKTVQEKKYEQEEVLNEGEAKNEDDIIDRKNISVYLKSIMYISQNSWAVWLNDTKITNLTNGDEEISVLSLSPLKAKLLWKIGLTKWEIVNANKSIPESKYTVKDNSVNLVFTISPNQTYIPSKNETIEGKIKEEPVLPPEEKDKEKDKENKKEEAKTEEEDDGIFF